jgi:hypothetical protein
MTIYHRGKGHRSASARRVPTAARCCGPIDRPLRLVTGAWLNRVNTAPLPSSTCATLSLQFGKNFVVHRVIAPKRS